MPALPFPSLLTETEDLSEVFQICDDKGVPYIDGLILSYRPDCDPESEEFQSIRFLYQVLVEDGQMTDKEAVTLIDNSFLSFVGEE
jgi:hypothetical protein